MRSQATGTPDIYLCGDQHLQLLAQGNFAEIPAGPARFLAQARQYFDDKTESIFQALKETPDETRLLECLSLYQLCFTPQIFEKILGLFPGANALASQIPALPLNHPFPGRDICPPQIREFISAKGWTSCEELLLNKIEILKQSALLNEISGTVTFWKKVSDLQAAKSRVLGEVSKDSTSFVDEISRMSTLIPMGIGNSTDGGGIGNSALGVGVASMLLRKDLDKREAEATYRKKELIYNPLKKVWEIDVEEPWRKFISSKNGLTILLGPLQLLHTPTDSFSNKQVPLEQSHRREAKNLLNIIDLLLPAFDKRLHFPLLEIETNPNLQTLVMTYKRLEEMWVFHLKRNPPRAADPLLAWMSTGKTEGPEEELYSILNKRSPTKGGGFQRGLAQTKCHNCGINGHTRATCRKPVQTAPYPPTFSGGKGKKGGGGKGKHGKGKSSGDSGNRACFTCGDRGHMANKCPNRAAPKG
jgi:hypothetical protein